jgi:AcrR family transcriptional regulator
LLDAAEAVFVERGYQNANIHEICARAKVGIGTFYAHFDNKRAMLRTVVAETAVTINDVIKVDDLIDAARLEARLRTLIEEPLSAGLWRAWHEAVHEHRDLQPFHDQWRADVIAEFARRIDEARARAGRVEARLSASTLAWLLLTGYRALAVHDRAAVPQLSELASASVVMILGDEGAGPA